MNLKRATLVSRVVILGFAAACLWHLTLARVFNLRWPYSTFLFDPGDRFMDFRNTLSRVDNLDPYYSGGPGVPAYFPFAFLALVPLDLFPRDTAFLLFAISVLCGVGLMSVLWARTGFPADAQGQAARKLAILTLLSYPFLFALDRGNLDLWIFLLVLMFVLGRRDVRWRWWGAVALAVATAIKVYPLLFLLLLIPERRYREAVAVLLSAGILTAVAMLVFEGGVTRSWTGLWMGLAAFKAVYVDGLGSLHYFADPYNAIRAFALLTHWDLSISRLQTVYSVAVGCLVCLVAVFVVCVPCPAWRKSAAIGATLLVFPVANDYKLLILLPGVFEFAIEEASLDGSDRWYLLLVGLLLVPKHYVFFKDLISLSCLLSPILVLSLLTVLLSDRAAWRQAYCGFPATLRLLVEPGRLRNQGPEVR